MIKILGPRNRGDTTITKTTLNFCYFFGVILFGVIFAFGNFCLDCSRKSVAQTIGLEHTIVTTASYPAEKFVMHSIWLVENLWYRLFGLSWDKLLSWQHVSHHHDMAWPLCNLCIWAGRNNQPEQMF